MGIHHRMAREKLHHRRHDEQMRHAKICDGLQKRFRFKSRHSHQLGAHRESAQRNDGEAKNVKHRQKRKNRGAIGRWKRLVELADIRYQGSVRQHHAFGQAGRAGGVRQRRDRIGICGHARL